MTDPIKPTTFVLDVTAANGVPFRVVAWAAGAVGLSPHRKSAEHALVDFYDRRYQNTEHGQFVGAGYRICDLTDDGVNPRRGLNLVHGVADWSLDVDTYAVVLRWLVSLGLVEATPAKRMVAERLKEAGARTRETFPEAAAVMVEPTAESGQVVGVYAAAGQHRRAGHYALWTLDDEDSEAVAFPGIEDVSTMVVAAMIDDPNIGTLVKGGGVARWLVTL